MNQIAENGCRATHVRITRLDDVVRLAFGRNFEDLQGAPVCVVTVDTLLALVFQMGFSGPDIEHGKASELNERSKAE